MFDIGDYLQKLIGECENTFRERLLYVGLQDKPLGNCDRLGVVSRHKRLREHDCARSGGYSENCTYMSCSHLTPNSLTPDP